MDAGTKSQGKEPPRGLQGFRSTFVCVLRGQLSAQQWTTHAQTLTIGTELKNYLVNSNLVQALGLQELSISKAIFVFVVTSNFQ